MRVESPPSFTPPPEVSADEARRTRDEGLSLAARATRWIIAGALALAAALTGLTAHSFHPKAASTPSRSATGPAASAPTSTGDDPAPLQAPATTPAPAPQTPAPAAVSGGS